MKHSDVIEKLDPLRKVALVASGLSDEPLEQAGLPPVGRAELLGLSREKGVSLYSAARSWDPDLIGKMTEELSAEGAEEGVRLAVTPDLKATVDPYAVGLSEDPVLNGTLGAGMAAGAHKAGIAAAYSRFSIGESETAWLDRRENKGATRELVVQPFLTACEKEPCEAVVLSPVKTGAGYPSANRALFHDVTGGILGDVLAVGEDVPAAAESIFLLEGKATLGGARIPLERASRRYARLAQYLQEGSITERDLGEAVRDGSALSDERLNEAADEVADFALRLADLTPALPEGEEGRKQLAEDCIVLLRNERVLPLSNKTKLAIVGEAYGDLSAIEERFTVIGRARGYNRMEERSDELIPEAVRAAGKADAVLVFLYPAEEGRTLTLPANRLALLAALKKTGRRIIAAVCGDKPVDLGFDLVCAATLLVPEDGPYAGEALARVLSGECNPSGKLTRTYLDGADTYFATWQKNRAADRVRIGSFVGYRRTDAEGISVRYPFGFGLSYTKFSYSRLVLEGDKVTFTVHNAGGRDGAEVAQVYVGAPSETHVEPNKRLKAFVKIFLKKGESKTVTLTLPAEKYGTFDPAILSESVEKGVYRVYVCASAGDVRLQGKRTLEGETRERAAESYSDYFLDADFGVASKVSKENRVTDESAKGSARLRTARKVGLVAFPILAVLLFLFATVFVFSYVFHYALLTFLSDSQAEWAMYATAVAMLAVIPLLGSLNRKRLSHVRSVSIVLCPLLLFVCLILGAVLMYDGATDFEWLLVRFFACVAVGAPVFAIVSAIVEREVVRSKSGINRYEKFYFEEREEEAVTPEADFEEAFRVAEQKKEETPAAPAEEEPAEEIAEIPQFYDKYLTYDVLLRECKQFLNDRGANADEVSLRHYLAALSSSRLIFLPAGEGEGARMCRAVAEYFGQKAFVDNAEAYEHCEGLFAEWKNGTRAYATTEFTSAIHAAKREGAYLYTAFLRHVPAGKLSELFAPIAELVSRRKSMIQLPDGSQTALPPNLRIVVEVEAERVELPASLSEVAAVLSPKCKEGTPARKKTAVQAVGYERFASLAKSVRDEFPLGETVWKSVDRLDEKCLAAHIGNLLWVRLEVHASVAAALGAEEGEAIDGAIAYELIPWLEATWDKEVCGGDLPSALTEVFGKQAKLCKEACRTQGGKETKR